MTKNKKKCSVRKSTMTRRTIRKRLMRGGNKTFVIKVNIHMRKIIRKF